MGIAWLKYRALTIALSLQCRGCSGICPVLFARLFFHMFKRKINYSARAISRYMAQNCSRSAGLLPGLCSEKNRNPRYSPDLE